MARHRREHGVGEDGGDERRGRFERQHHGARVRRGDAQRLDRHGPGLDRPRVLQLVGDFGNLRARLRVGRPAHPSDEILRRQRRAVGPDEALAQREGPHQPVVGDGPAFRLARHDAVVGILRRQPLEQVAQDDAFRQQLVFLRVERVGIVAVGAAEDVGDRRPGQRRRQQEDRGEESHGRAPACSRLAAMLPCRAPVRNRIARPRCPSSA